MDVGAYQAEPNRKKGVQRDIEGNGSEQEDPGDCGGTPRTEKGRGPCYEESFGDGG